MKQCLIKQIEAVLPSPKAVIAIVGAGGKTTCMYQLAKSLIEADKKVLITTTTKIFHPEHENRDNWKLFLGPLHGQEIHLPNKDNQIDIAALEVDPNQNKLIGYTAEDIDDSANEGRYDYILVEADGAKQKPIKAPDQNEPVIPGSASMVIGIIGLDSLGKHIDEVNVHRHKLLADLTLEPLGSEITESTLVKLICSKIGLFKDSLAACRKIVMLNKADTQELHSRGELVKSLLEKEKDHGVGIHEILIGSFKFGPH